MQLHQSSVSHPELDILEDRMEKLIEIICIAIPCTFSYTIDKKGQVAKVLSAMENAKTKLLNAMVNWTVLTAKTKDSAVFSIFYLRYF